MSVIIQLVNTLVLLFLVIGIPLFMFTVLRLLKEIESRLENLEKRGIE